MADGDYLLSGISGGLGGLIEAYKMRMGEKQEDAKLRQSGLNVRGSSESADGHGGSGLTPEEITTWARHMVVTGTPLSSVGTRGVDRARIGAAYIKARKEYDAAGGKPSWAGVPGIAGEPGRESSIGGLEAQQKAAMGQAGAMNQAGMLQSLAAFPQFQAALNAYQESMGKIAPGEFIPANKAKQWAVENIGSLDPEYGAELQRARAAMTEIGMQGSRVFAGTAMQQKPFEEELKRLATTNPLSRVQRTVDLMRKLAQERETELRSGKVNVPALQEAPVFPAGRGGTPPAAEGFTSDKAARLEELRRKRAEGALR